MQSKPSGFTREAGGGLRANRNRESERVRRKISDTVGPFGEKSLRKLVVFGPDSLGEKIPGVRALPERRVDLRSPYV